MRAFVLLLLACGSEPGPRSPRPPPAALTLTVPTLAGGATVALTASGAAPGEAVLLGVTTAGAGAGPCPLPGLCLDLLPPVSLLGQPRADAVGRAVLDVVVPPMRRRAEVCLQAIAVRGVDGADSLRSPPVCATVWPAGACQATDADRDGVDACGDCDDDDDAVGAPQAWLPDSDGDGAGDPALATGPLCAPPGAGFSTIPDCDDGDPSVRPGAFDAPGDGVDADCDGGDAATCLPDLDGDGVGGACGADDTGETGLACPFTASDGQCPSGWAPGSDCDDADPAVFPAAPERCDEIDQDCDGLLANGLPDLDGDDTPDCVDPDVDGDGDPSATDCDDRDPSRSSRTAETCNDRDDDCDGAVDEGSTIGGTWYRDADGDGWGTSTTTRACDRPAGWASRAGDCDDSDPTTFPGATERCFGGDDDCDGAVDEGVGTLWYTDADRDGYGAGAGVLACTQPAGRVDRPGDCDDTQDWIRPGLQMSRLVGLWHSANEDSAIAIEGSAAHAALTAAGYRAATPYEIGWTVTRFAPGYGVTTAWRTLTQGNASTITDRMVWSGSFPTTHDHGLGADHDAQRVDLGWVRAADLGDATRHFYRVWNPTRRNHRMSASGADRDELVQNRGYVDDGTAGWVFSSDRSCP